MTLPEMTLRNMTLRNMTLIDLFRQAVAARPHDVAVVSSRGTCTYAELSQRARRVSQALRPLGVGREVTVGVAVPRSIESLTAVLGVLGSGGAYVPIDPAYPIERQRLVAEDAGLRVLIVDSRQQAPPDLGIRVAVVDLANTDADPAANDEAELDEGATGSQPADLLYILYSSGSTGRPKGVCGTHQATLNRLTWAWRAQPFSSGEVVGHRSSLSFVDAEPEMWSGLLQGVPTAILHPEEVLDLGLFVSVLRRFAVTRLTVVPSILAALLRRVPALGEALPALRTWITSGEELPLPLLQAFRAAAPQATLYNLYGTTEVTGDVTCAVFGPEAPLPPSSVPIGEAMADAELWILDSQGAAVPDGKVGELYVGGPVLARGYHRRPAEEALRFPRCPARPSDRVFRTGDLVRRDDSGSLHYVGRVDNQIKLRGVRIELEEIERTLRSACPELGDIAVVRTDADELVAFVTPLGLPEAPLRQAAERLLPEVMRPSRYLPIDALPHLPNGKCDRRTLLLHSRQAQRQIPASEQPQTTSERRLAALFSSLLRRPDIARGDSFSALGGDSLGLAELLLSINQPPTIGRVELGLARQATLAQLARVLDGEEAATVVSAAASRSGSAPAQPATRGGVASSGSHAVLADPTALTLTPLCVGGEVPPDVLALFLEASADAALCAMIELPGGMDAARARAYCLASDGVVIRLHGQPVGAGIAQSPPNVGQLPPGVTVPAGSAQLEEWLLPRFRNQGILSEAGAWPQLAAWLAQRFAYEVSAVWEDHVAMLAILQARGYQRLGRSLWQSAPGSDGTSGMCEVWIYDLAAARSSR